MRINQIMANVKEGWTQTGSCAMGTGRAKWDPGTLEWKRPGSDPMYLNILLPSGYLRPAGNQRASGGLNQSLFPYQRWILVLQLRVTHRDHHFNMPDRSNVMYVLIREQESFLVESDANKISNMTFLCVLSLQTRNPINNSHFCSRCFIGPLSCLSSVLQKVKRFLLIWGASFPGFVLQK